MQSGSITVCQYSNIEGDNMPTKTVKRPPDTAVDKFAQRIEKMSIKSILKNIGPLMQQGTPYGYRRMIERVWLEGTEEQAAKFCQDGFDYLKKACDESVDNSTEIFPGYESEAVVDAVNKAAVTIATVWKERQAAKQGKGVK